MWSLVADPFVEGADAWILPEPKKSEHSRQVDFQLGFPYANWQSRPTPQRSETLLTWTDPSFEFRCAEDAAFVCPSAGRLNCQWVVFLPIQHSADWLTECQKIIQQLNIQSPRLWIHKTWKEELLKVGLLPVGSYVEYE